MSNVSKLKSNYVSLINQHMSRFSNIIQEGNQKYGFYRGCISISEDSVMEGTEEDNIIYCISLLASDINGTFKVIKFDVDFDRNDLIYYNSKWDIHFSNEKEVMNGLYSIIEDLLDKVPVDFDKFYWDFNQYLSFKQGFVISSKKSTYIMMDNGQSYTAEHSQCIGSASETCKGDKVLCGTWKPNFV